MSTATRRSFHVEERARTHVVSAGNGSAGNGRANGGGSGNGSHGSGSHGNNGTAKSGSHVNGARQEPKPRVLVSAENRLAREALSRMLTKNGDIEVIGGELLSRFKRQVKTKLKAPFRTTTRACPRLLCPRIGGSSAVFQGKSGSRPGGDSQDPVRYAGGDDPADRRDRG